MAEQPLDARSSAAFLYQRWRALLGAGIVGLVLGIGYGVLVPAQMSSTALILLPDAEGTTTDGQIATQLQVLNSAPVLEQAGRSVTPARSLEEMRRRVRAEATTSQVMEVVGSSRSPAQSQALAQAVVDAYIAVLRDNTRNLTDAARSDLSTREADLTEQLEKLQAEIVATGKRRRGEPADSPQSQRDSQLLAQLTAEQANVSLQLDKVKQNIVEYEATGTGSVTALIIQNADRGTGPGPVRRSVTWSGVGALTAATLAAILLLVRRRRDRRLRARDDLADAVGSAVIADVQSRPQSSIAEWLAFFETHQASAVETWAFRQALRALVPHAGLAGSRQLPVPLEHPPSITVVTLAGDDGALAVGPQLATFAASVGISTWCVLASGHDNAAALTAACSIDRGGDLRPGLHLGGRLDTGAPLDGRDPTPAQSGPDGESGGTASQLTAEVTNESVSGYPWVGVTTVRSVAAPTPRARSEESAPGSDQSRSRLRPGTLRPSGGELLGDLSILLVVADPAEPTLKGVPVTAATVLAISPGVGSREELARLAVAVDDAGRRIDGIIVADPDPADRTSGRLTLDERARQEPLPVRTTGIGQVSAHPRARG